MKIADYLQEENIKLNIKTLIKKDVIKETADLLKKSPQIVNFTEFCSDIFKREDLGTTSVGNGIAIPHARTNAVNNFVIAFGRTEKGIDFGAQDKHPVRLIFLMGAHKEKGLSNYLKIITHLTRLLQKEEFRNTLLTASTAQEIIENFRKIEN